MRDVDIVAREDSISTGNPFIRQRIGLQIGNLLLQTSVTEPKTDDVEEAPNNYSGGMRSEC